jgi:5,10-methylenetetrahydromethanopterin reductase
VLQRFRADPVISGAGGALDAAGTAEQLAHAATLIPAEWLAASATGSPTECAATVGDQLAFGCDGVILHGCTPEELRPVVDAYRGSSQSGGNR